MSKRTYELDSDELSGAKKCHTGEDKLEQFKEWCQHENINISNKVVISQEGSCDQYGMVACEDIAEGEVLAEIPRSALLTTKTTSIAQLLIDNSREVESTSGWVPLLLALMYEASSRSSKWTPYLQLFPNYDHLDLPMFWPRDELESQLKSTGVPDAVQKDVASIEKEFRDIVLPFVQKHGNVFPSQCQDLQFYKRTVAFVMSYSFTEPSSLSGDCDDADDGSGGTVSPMMVPVADILNHVAKNNARLDFGAATLSIVSTTRIQKGMEVFNTYGELPNSQLLHMYGFAEDPSANHNDLVDLSVDLLREQLSTSSQNSEQDLLSEKWKLLENMGLTGEGEFCMFSSRGILNMDQVKQILKVLTLEANEFVAYKEQDGWSEEEEDEGDDDESNDDCLSPEKIFNLPQPSKQILCRWAEWCLARYDTSLKQEEFLQTQKLARRHTFAAHVRYGQIRLLHDLILLCSS